MPADAINIEALRQRARRRLPGVVFDFLEGGAEDETSLRGNRAAFQRLELLPRMLTGHASVDTSVEVLGTRMDVPFLIGPTGCSSIFWPKAELAMAQAAASVGTRYVVSSASNVALPRITATQPGVAWFQLYPWGDRELTRRLMNQARAAGCEVLIVTIDTLTGAKRERDIRNRVAHYISVTPKSVVQAICRPMWSLRYLAAGGAPSFPLLESVADCPNDGKALARFLSKLRNPEFNWQDIAWIRRNWQGPLVVKGILHPDDARRCVQEQVDGLVLSNHGGRQLDGAVSALSVLPEVVETVDGRAAILIDGGFRRGTDIVKALSLGAAAVLLGRAPLYGLAAGGAAGARQAVHILADEVRRTMAMLGVSCVRELSPRNLRHVDHVGHPAA